jgi:biotin carboxyl carrier protein
MTDHERTPAERLADHDRIQHLAEELLPELAGRLAAAGLGEIEIREDGWRVRVRRPAGSSHRGEARRAAERPRAAGASGAHATHAAPVPAEREETASRGRGGAPAPDPSGSGAPGSGDPLEADPPVHRINEHRVVAVSPAVGIFQSRPEIHSGSRVRAGDRLAFVDLLGVPQDVVAPGDGVVIETLVDHGDGVEYGQDLVVIELVTSLVTASGGQGGS